MSIFSLPFQHYFHALAIADVLPARYGLSYLEAKMQDYKGTYVAGDSSNINTRLIDVYLRHRETLVKAAKNEEPQMKEILQKLYAILVGQFEEKEDSRAIIFGGLNIDLRSRLRNMLDLC